MDLTKIRTGDTVTIRATVQNVNVGREHPRNERFLLDIPTINGTVREWFDGDKIVSHEPQPLVVGDRVTWESVAPLGSYHAPSTGRVIALYDGRAWVREDEDPLPGMLLDLRLLTRADA